MYTPPAFREDRPEILHRLMAQARLATLVSNGAGGVPDITLLPLMHSPGQGIILGHLARANPHWKALRAAGRAIAIFQGAEGYISPSSYPSKAEHHRVVPTWNYEAVLAEGPVEIVEDAARLHEIVSSLTDLHEGARANPWRVTDAPEDFIQGQLKGIVGMVLRIETLTGKRKLSQNRNAADREGALAGLTTEQAALAHAMRAQQGGE
ncbi:FMN-binding negative transcriptional regulator [Roseococcus microcysteis]|uniref:FMN-binding negative transcriptional regulator n=1 Tax=Roseococcus microcysteis TaxID=2771361 RepID=UPI00168A8DE5|nr:FMN-binding negative transcriptional regulator [Roseococcus microcysteis]